MLVLTLKISLLETGLVLLCHLAAMVGSFYTAAPFWGQIVTVLLLLCSLIFQIRQAWLNSNSSLIGLTIGPLGGQLHYRREIKEVSQLAPYYVSAWLLVLRCQVLTAQQPGLSWVRWFGEPYATYVVLFADSLSAEKLRQLRVYLRFAYFYDADGEKSPGTLTND